MSPSLIWPGREKIASLEFIISFLQHEEELERKAKEEAERKKKEEEERRIRIERGLETESEHGDDGKWWKIFSNIQANLLQFNF